MIQRLHHGLISLVEWDGFLRRNRLVTRERLPDVSRERSVKRFEQLQEEHEDLVPVGQQLIAAGIGGTEPSRQPLQPSPAGMPWAG